MKISIILLGTICCVVSGWHSGRWQYVFLTLPQIHAKAQEGKLKTSRADKLLGAIGMGLILYGSFWA
jgi:hypothetical protein